MNPQTFVNVSGIDHNVGASVVFVWCRHKEAGDDALLGAGHVVGAAPESRPPGVLAGQFCVTLPLPAGYSLDDVFVTDDIRGQERVRGIRVSTCVARSGSLPREAASGPAGRPEISRAHGSVSMNGRG
jgi:hypothetical protein